MTYLLYGIVSSAEASSPFIRLRLVMPSGVGSTRLRLIEANNLGAVVSSVAPADLVPTVANAMTYAKAVEAIHTQRTIMPMRYGCTRPREDEIVQLLYAQGRQYADILRRVDGCVELGVHVSLPEIQQAESPPLLAQESHAPAAYLARRASFYAARDRRAREIAEATERMRGALEGHYVRFRAGEASVSQPQASAIFLVKRHSLPRFRTAFLKFAGTEPGAARLSGPWPPYNFVIAETSHGRRLS